MEPGILIFQTNNIRSYSGEDRRNSVFIHEIRLPLVQEKTEKKTDKKYKLFRTHTQKKKARPI